MAADSQPTELLFLEDTYLFEAEAVILNVDADAKGNFLVLDKTLFYAQSGGQPCDTGAIICENLSIEVNFVAFANEQVRHYTPPAGVSNDLIGKKVSLKINQERRLENAKSHTAGHLLACVIESLAAELQGIKGYHFPEGPYVEFKGKLASYSTELLIEKANQLLEEKISNQMNISVSRDGEDTVHNRLVTIDSLKPVPCGGTHLKNTNELKQVKIKKVKFPKGNTQISYSYL